MWRRRNLTAGSKEDYGPNQFRVVGGEHTRHAISKRMPSDVHRSQLQRFDHTGHIGSKRMQGDIFSRASTLSGTSEIDSNHSISSTSQIA
jgi:hypothetical protein